MLTRTSHFMCLEQDKATKHYFTNTFATEPTPEQKQNEVLLVKHRMEAQLNRELIDCHYIEKHEVPNELSLSPLGEN